MPAGHQDRRARVVDSTYQYTIWGPYYQEMALWAPQVYDKLRTLPELVDVSTDRDRSGLQVNVVADRVAAARLGVRIQDIDIALNNAFGQRQISTLYSQRNQYRVILEIDPQYQRDPNDLSRIYVPGANGVQVPLSAVTTIRRGLQPLVVNHQGQFPSATVSFSLAHGREHRRGDAGGRPGGRRAAHARNAARGIHGRRRAYRQSIGAQPLLIIAALLAVYIVLGVLYESLAHPLTIISTLPSAGPRRAAGAEAVQDRPVADRLHRHHPVDRHRQEERHHDGRLRARCRTQPRAVARAGDLRGLPRALPPDHDDDAGGIPRRAAAGDRERRRARSCAGRSASPSWAGFWCRRLLTLYTTPVIYLLLDRLHHRMLGRRAAARERGTLWRNLVRAFRG